MANVFAFGLGGAFNHSNKSSMHEFSWLDLPATRLPSGSTPLLVASFTTNVEENTEKFSTNEKNSIWFGFIPSFFFVALCFWFVAIVHRKRGRLYDNQFDSHCVCVHATANWCDGVRKERTNEQAQVMCALLCYAIPFPSFRYSHITHSIQIRDSTNALLMMMPKLFFSFPFFLITTLFSRNFEKVGFGKAAETPNIWWQMKWQAEKWFFTRII